jgi:hypothetical protein
MKLRTVLLSGALAAGASTLAFGIMPSKSRLILTSTGIHFPTVSGFNLDRQELEFPRDFAGDLNVLFVPFLRRQQEDVDSWVPFVSGLEADTPGLAYYELPTIYEMSSLSRMFLNEGMRAGIPNRKSRQRTITLYLDRAKFMRATGIPDERQVHILLVDREGRILWREAGRFDDDKGRALVAAVAQHRPAPPETTPM